MHKLISVAAISILALQFTSVADACYLRGSEAFVHSCATSSLGGAITLDSGSAGNPYSQSLTCWYGTNPPADGGTTASFGVACATDVGSLQTAEETSRPTNTCGSIIDVGLQTVAEQIPVVGTGQFLRYDSGRQFGFAARRTIIKPLSGSTAPALSSATLQIGIEGQTVTQNYTSFTSNMSASTTWDGKDGSGVMVAGGTGCARAQIQETPLVIPCDSDGHCAYPATMGNSSGSGVCGGASTGSLPIGGWNPKDIGLAGWTLSNVHHYDNLKQIIELGSGGTIPVVTQFAGGVLYRAGAPDSNELYLFNGSGLHVKTINALTGSTKLTIAYHTDGRLDTITDAYSKVTSIVYNGSLKATKIVGPYGHETLLTVDSLNNLTQVTAPDLTYHQMTYVNSQGLIASFTKPLGQTSTFTYDGLGQLTQDAGVDSFVANLVRSVPTLGTDRIVQTSAEGITTRHDITYDSAMQNHLTTKYLSSGNRATVTENATSVSTNQWQRFTKGEVYDYDPRFGTASGRKYMKVSSYTKASTGSGPTTSISKAVSYLSGTGPFNIDTLTTTATTGGLAYQEIYTGSTNQLQYVTPLSRTTTVTLNSQERPSAYQFADLTSTAFTYNGDGQVSRLDQGARYVAYTYNAAGLVASVENALGEITAFTYDSNDRLVSTTLPDTNVIAYTWDANDNLKSVTPPTRSAHAFNFTLSDKVSSYVPPSLTGTVTTGYQYDMDRRLKKITRPNTDEISLTYTGYLATKVTIPLGDYTFTYDSLNDLMSVAASPYGITETILRADDFVTEERLTGNGYGRIAYTYDGKFRPDTIDIRNSSGTSLNSAAYTYNNDSEITAIADLSLTRHSTRSYVTALALDNVSESRGYNSFGELNAQTASYSSTTRYGAAITRDNLGRVTTNVENVNGTTTTYGYTYNTVGRLTAVTKGGSAYSSYAYDANGNRTSRTISGATVSATTDAQDRLLTHGTLSFTYNQNGEMLTKADSATSTTTTYSYDAMGNLSRVDLPGGSNYVEYLMDGFNRRHVRKYNGSVDRYFIYQNQLQVAAELSSSGTLIARYFYASRSNVPDYMVKSGVNYRIVSDQLGSVRLVVRASDGVIMQQMDYDEFGRVLADSSPGFQPFGFAGGLYDGDSKLVHFVKREYDAEIGQWISKDPIVFGGGDTNLYAYVGGDPVNFVDPMGLRITDITGGKIPASVIGSAAYQRLAGRSDVNVIIRNDRDLANDLGQTGHTNFSSSRNMSVIPGAPITISIDFDFISRNMNLLESTFAHEFLHAENAVAFEGLNSEAMDHMMTSDIDVQARRPMCPR